MTSQWLCLILYCLFAEVENLVYIWLKTIDKGFHTTVKFLYFIACIAMFFHPVLCWVSLIITIGGFIRITFLKGDKFEIMDSLICITILILAPLLTW